MANMNYTHGRCKAPKPNGDQCKNNSMPNSPYCGPHHKKYGDEAAVMEDKERTKAERVKRIHDNKEEDIAIYEEQFWSQWDYVLTGTGTRKLQNADKDTKVHVMNELVQKVNELKEEHDNLVIMSGGAEGFDSALIAAAINCGVPYVMALPSPTYGEYYWGKKSQTGYNRLDKFKEYMEGAAQVIYVCDDHQWGKANFIRNDYMMKWAQEVLAYDPTGKSTGTQHAIKRANKGNLKVTYLDTHGGGSPKVLNKRNSEDGVYIGRPTKWGNPFTHRKDVAEKRNLTLTNTREEAVSKYREYLLANDELMDALPELAGQNLVCWCAPKACHGDVLIELAN